MKQRETEVVIIGAGFGGIGMAIELQREGFSKITILEKADGVGGTWLHNGYPGAACDVPSFLYSYSYEQRKHWPRFCSARDVILEYIEEVAAKYGIDRMLETGVAVSSCAWDDEALRWTISSEDGRSWESDAVVIATGQLHQPAIPRIEGREDFEGEAFHSAEWNHDYDLTGKRVAVLGTGASAVQFVPEIAEVAGRVDVYQRSGNWFMPRDMRDFGLLRGTIFRKLGGARPFRWWLYWYGELLTLMIRHPKSLGLLGRARSWVFMRRALKDPEVRKKAWPDYTFGCKRVLFSSLWLPAIQRENVDLITDAARQITAGGVKTDDGTEREVDCIIWGTGFKTNDFMFPMAINGAGGKSLQDAWSDGARAHLGMTVPGFPSMFLMYGPNTNTSGGSIIVYLEAQARYIRQALEYAEDRGAAIDVRPVVEEVFDRKTQGSFEGTAWTRCDSWYRNEGGRIIANWPGYMYEYEKRTAVLDPTEYELIEKTAEQAEEPSGEPVAV